MKSHEEFRIQTSRLVKQTSAASDELNKTAAKFATFRQSQPGLMASPSNSNPNTRKRLSPQGSGEKVGDTDSIHSKHGRDGKHSQIMKPNPFYRKRIKTIVSTQRSIILRLPHQITNALGLAFHNFNPRACLWVDKLYAEKLFACFPESFKTKS